jgi:3',5'-cyclic AMP phosphodiesterase CpdA
MSTYTIAQLSDLHVGEAGYREDMVLTAIEEINQLSPDLTLVAGDLTWNGIREQFEGVRDVLNRIKGPRIVIMGNHDAANVGYLLFEELFGARFREHKDERVFLLGVDSSQPDLDTGHISREHQRYIGDVYDKADKSLIKVLALHHHLVPVPRSGRERDILVDAGDILELMMHKGVSLVLSGHRHVPWVWRVENMLLVYSGTCGSPRLRASPAHNYNIIRIGKATVEVTTKFVAGQARLKARCRWGKRGITG